MLNNKVLKELMIERDIKNIKELSIKTNIPSTTLYYMLSGHDLYVSTLVTLSKFFNVPVDYLINKNYGIYTYTDNTSSYIDNTSLIEEIVLSGTTIY